MSLSSFSRLSSIVTRLTSCRQVMTTFTMPGARLPFDFDRRELLLHLLHVFLHLLRLLHQARQAGLFMICLRSLLRAV